MRVAAYGNVGNLGREMFARDIAHEAFDRTPSMLVQLPGDRHHVIGDTAEKGVVVPPSRCCADAPASFSHPVGACEISKPRTTSSSVIARSSSHLIWSSSSPVACHFHLVNSNLQRDFRGAGADLRGDARSGLDALSPQEFMDMTGTHAKAPATHGRSRLRLCGGRGAPATIEGDKGTEGTSIDHVRLRMSASSRGRSWDPP